MAQLRQESNRTSALLEKFRYQALCKSLKTIVSVPFYFYILCVVQVCSQGNSNIVDMIQLI